MKRVMNRAVIGVVGLVLAGLTGCGVYPVMTEENGRRPFAMGKSDQVLLPNAPAPVHLSEEYGVAYRQALEGQIANPAASRNLDPVPGVADPQGLQYSATRYQLYFKNPPFSDWEMKETSSKKSSSSSSNPQSSSGGGSK